MTWFTALLLMVALGAVAAVAALAGARRRLALELATTRERASAALAGPGRSIGLLASSAAPPESDEVPAEINDAARAAGGAESVEAELRCELSRARAETTERDAEIARLREEARLGAEVVLRGKQALSADVAGGADVAEALRLAEEEARVARIARDSFAGESRLLREELRRVTARLAEATRGASDARAAPLSAVVAPPVAGRTSMWWCNACGRGGNSAEPCCANAR